MNRIETPGFDPNTFLCREPPLGPDGKRVNQKLIDQVDDRAHKDTKMYFGGKSRVFTDFIDDSFELDPTLRDKIIAAIKELPLIDLGTDSPCCSGLLDHIGAKPAEYMCVDKYPRNMRDVKEKLNCGFPYKQERCGYCESLIPHYVQADMLDFLEHVPDGSSNVCITSIDGSIISDSEYHKRVAEEIARVCKPRGLVFSFNSSAVFHLWKDHGFRKLLVRPFGGDDRSQWAEGFNIFEKPDPSDQIDSIRGGVSKSAKDI